ncbi:MAG: hypothetical protein PGN23_06960 [Sphingomonas adhaesiva]|uniref:hypothetical protein n=1 Tax=Sphingomonas adhaesiva TaxID=28212 RepID=UPI002FF8300E
MPRKLKVFRTSIGFHDAYVAAPSQKAALTAWGATANLFTRGMAEEVLDPKLMEEPLSRPGEVIRKARGTMADHLAALPEAPIKPAKLRSKNADRRTATPAAKNKRRPVPPPSRKKLDAAVEAVRVAELAYAEQRRELEEREAEVRRVRRALEGEHAGRMKELEERRASAEADYRSAIEQWKQT